MSGGRPGWRRWLLLAPVLLLGSACKLELDVNVEVTEQGSGVVEVVVGLDPDALAKVGGDLAAVIEVDELADAGWTIDGPAAESDGFTRVRIRHSFANPAEAARVFARLEGEGGPFQRFAITRQRSFAETTWGFTGKVAFSGGLEALGERALPAGPDGEPMGGSVEELEAQLGDSLSRLLQVRVSVRLPGDVTSNATTKADNGAVWQVGFGEGSVDLNASGRERRTSAVVLVVAGVAVALALGMWLLLRAAARVTANR